MLVYTKAKHGKDKTKLNMFPTSRRLVSIGKSNPLWSIFKIQIFAKYTCQKLLNKYFFNNSDGFLKNDFNY